MTREESDFVFGAAIAAAVGVLFFELGEQRASSPNVIPVSEAPQTDWLSAIESGLALV